MCKVFLQEHLSYVFVRTISNMSNGCSDLPGCATYTAQGCCDVLQRLERQASLRSAGRTGRPSLHAARAEPISGAGTSRFLSAPSRCSGLVEMTTLLQFSKVVPCCNVWNDRLRFALPDGRGVRPYILRGRSFSGGWDKQISLGTVALLRRGRNDNAPGVWTSRCVFRGLERQASLCSAGRTRRPSLHTARAEPFVEAEISRFLSAPSRCSGLVETTTLLQFSKVVPCCNVWNDRLRFAPPDGRGVRPYFRPEIVILRC
jgi:hypothetical protein